MWLNEEKQMLANNNDAELKSADFIRLWNFTIWRKKTSEHSGTCAMRRSLRCHFSQKFWHFNGSSQWLLNLWLQLVYIAYANNFHLLLFEPKKEDFTFLTILIANFNLFNLFQFNQDLYSTSGVPLTSSSASVSSHSPCSPILPQSVALNATQTGGSTTIPTIPLGSLHRSIAKEEDLSSVTRQSDNDGKCFECVYPPSLYAYVDPFHLLWC